MRIFLLLPLLATFVSSLSSSSSSSSSITRRDLLASGVGASSLLFIPPPAALAVTEDSSFVSDPEAGRYYFPALTPPFQNRATYRYDLGRQ